MQAGNAHYRKASDLPDVVPVFPLVAGLLLPRGQMPLNIFEPRYLVMIDEVLAGERLIGIIQPKIIHGVAVEDKEGAAIAGQLGIQSIPAVIAFVNGQPVDGFMGALPESKIKEFIDKVAKSAGSVGGPQAAIDEALAAAQEMREHGEPDQAAQIYVAVLQTAPDNVTALAGLADCLFDAGELEKAREVLAQVPEKQKDDAQVRAVEARLALAEQVAHLGNPAELQARLAADPNDHQARFDLAMIANALDKRDEAADGLLAIMKADRTWNDDGARKQLLQFFEAWGFKDPATSSGRRKLSSLLFS